MQATLQLESIFHDSAVRQAWHKVRSNRGAPGTDRITIEELEPVFDQVWPAVGQAIKAGTYYPLPLRVVPIPKPSGGTRELAIPSVMDRVVQQAMAQGISACWEPRFSSRSFAYRPGRSAADALDQVLVEAGRFPEPWAASLDIEDFFDSVPFEQTRHVLRETPGSMDFQETAMRCVTCKRQYDHGLRLPQAGLPQGSPLSPVLANAVLHPLDLSMEQHRHAYTRYADNLLILASNETGAEHAQALAAAALASLGLRLNRMKSTIAPLAEVDFLGFGFHKSATGAHVLRISPEAMSACRAHLHILSAAGADREDLQTFFSQWLGYYNRASGGEDYEAFLREIAGEFLIAAVPATVSPSRGRTSYDGRTVPFGEPLPDPDASGPELWIPFARMLMRRVRVGAEFSRSGMLPRLSRIRVSIGRHHFSFRV